MDRRRAPRDEASANRAQLRWDCGESRARFLNISDTGALISTARGPEIGQAVWLSLDEPMRSESIHGRVVRNDGAGRVGIEFAEQCPFALHRAVSLGVCFEL
jgi:hypothetical protein